MVVKDRLAALQAVQTRKHSEDESDSSSARDPLLSEEHWSRVEDFLSRVSKVNAKLEVLESQVHRIKTIHSEILSQPDTNKGLTHELNGLYSDFTAESKVLRETVRELDKEAQESHKDDDINNVDNRIRKSQVMTIVKRMCQVVTKFNSEQIEYKERRRKNITQYLKIQGLDVSEDSVMEAVENGDIDGLTKGLVLAVADKKALFAEVKSRKDELLKLEESLLKLHEMFQDLHLLVLSQGEMIDNIEANVQSAVDYADKAKENVIGARQAQKRARKMKICICIGVIVLVLLLLFFLQAAVCAYTPLC